MSSITPTRISASSASEWLSETAPLLIDAPDVARTDQLGAIAFLAAALERQTVLAAPPTHAMSALHDALEQIPAQLVHLPDSHAAHRWLQLSALAESLGEPALARVIINALAALLGEHAPTVAAVTDPLQCELLALCWTRRGRMSRVAGALDDAQACFEEAIALVAHQPWRDARSAAELGLANLAVAHGNYPRVDHQCSALLDRTDGALAPIHRVAAYQMRAIARRKRQRWLDALLDSWCAYDLLGHASAHRAELVVSMAETALEAGDLCAAVAGFGNARREAQSSGAQFRVQAAAITGLARTINACLHNGTPGAAALPATQVREARASLETLLNANLAPRERVYALITLGEWDLREQRGIEARAVLAEARALATTHAYFDYQFRADTLLELLDAPVADRGPAAPRAAVWQESERHPALARLAALA